MLISFTNFRKKFTTYLQSIAIPKEIVLGKNLVHELNNIGITFSVEMIS